jgi:sensor histidine kinase YesM
MIPYLGKKWYLRLLSGILLGLLTWLLAEVLLNIRYRYFMMFREPDNYLYAMLLGVCIIESHYRYGKYLDKNVPWREEPGKRLLSQLPAGVLTAFIWVTLIRLAVNYFLMNNKLIIFADEAMLFVLSAIMLMGLSMVEFAFHLNENYRSSLAEVERFRKENAEYQFEMLKLQLNPHFLFNSLNTLASLVHEDAGKAAEFTRKLSDVYRYVLENRNKELVKLKDEIAFFHAFSYLLGLRFQGMIGFHFDISEASLERSIAPMTMQLLIENAVKHNVVSARAPLQIYIIANDEKLIIQNNLQPKNDQPGTGTGLKNIISRYSFLTERKVEISRDDKFFTAIIPLI